MQSFSKELSTAAPSSAQVDLPLLRIDLLTFNGQIELQPEYIFLFDALVHTNNNLQPAQKYHYLRSSVTGEAATVISSFPLMADNYNLAYDALYQRYQNDRGLAHLYLNRILNFSNTKNQSLETLKEFIITHRNSVEGLKGLPISDLADFVLFSLGLQNLDPSTRQRFENSIPSDSVPTFSQLFEFTSQQLRVLENSGAALTSSSKKKFLHLI